MEGECEVTRSIIEEFHSWDIQRDQMEHETDVTLSFIDEHHSSIIEGVQMDGASGVA